MERFFLTWPDIKTHDSKRHTLEPTTLLHQTTWPQKTWPYNHVAVTMRNFRVTNFQKCSKFSTVKVLSRWAVNSSAYVWNVCDQAKHQNVRMGRVVWLAMEFLKRITPQGHPDYSPGNYTSHNIQVTTLTQHRSPGNQPHYFIKTHHLDRPQKTWHHSHGTAQGKDRQGAQHDKLQRRSAWADAPY